MTAATLGGQSLEIDATPPITISPEVQTLIPPLSADERRPAAKGVEP